MKKKKKHYCNNSNKLQKSSQKKTMTSLHIIFFFFNFSFTICHFKYVRSFIIWFFMCVPLNVVCAQLIFFLLNALSACNINVLLCTIRKIDRVR